ncbi:hypothetical protein [Glutamicibacter ardleyensis]|uniref:hypothetical protein n=1 Tax=Glutamicibacter ardleyensis TaxID=225894 RepID=UPI003FD08EB9
MESSEFASWLAAGLAGATFLGWIYDKWKARRDAPRVFLEFAVVGTANVGYDTYDLLEITNSGRADAIFATDLYFRNALPFITDGHTMPKVLKYGETIRLLFTAEDISEAYCIYVVMHHLRRKTWLAWEPLSHESHLHEELRAQLAIRSNFFARWLPKHRKQKAVGPGGAPQAILRRKQRNLDKQLTAALAVPEEELKQ